MHIHKAALGLLVASLPASLLSAQDSFKGRLARHSDIALLFTADETQTNYTRPGQTAAFTMTGASTTGTYSVTPHFSAVLDVGGTHINGVQDTGQSLTLITYMAGARTGFKPLLRFSPFLQFLVGGAHAPGGIYPQTAASSGGADGFALAPGAGLDYPLSKAISLRAQGEYLLTMLPNGADNREGIARISGGLVFRFGTGSGLPTPRDRVARPSGPDAPIAKTTGRSKH